VSDQPTPTGSTDPRINAALREYLERIDRGEPVDREEFISRHAEIADALRSFFAAEEPFRKMDAACGDDSNLRQRVERLLAAHPQAGAAEARTLPPRDNIPADPARAETVACDRPVEGVGAVIAGRYKLLETLGQGGMGAVFMAQQTQPVKRLVALKLIKLGMDSKQVLARFEAERQALALMDHPNIAKVLDAGTTDSGRPFFVMELVKGVPITRFCDERQLSPRQRLELFIPVCQAIQHAHQKGIIHRDIKPSNVLVALYDDRPVPKVIDFGVAKATGQQLTDASLMTGFGGIVGTPEYMSPEQAQLNQLDIDTRSDVYALGVLLYELLTGTTPIDRKRLGQGALFEILRIVREEEPPRPSARLSTSDALASIAATRKTEPARLAKLMRGELDWIVMKCLEKDRSRRYETANGLAHDVERYLHDEVVEAQPPTAGYRLRKLASRYRTALATTTIILLLLVAGVLASAWQAVRATRAEAEVRQERDAAKLARDKMEKAFKEASYAEGVAAGLVNGTQAALAEAVDERKEAESQRDNARVTAYASGMQLAQRAWEENNVVRTRELLEEVPKEAAGRKLRGFEWYYLSRLCHSEALTLEGHAGPVYSVAFSPDSKRLASASDDQAVKIWDSATGKELCSLKGHAGPVYSVAFSPDGKRLASASADQTVKIWNSATGKELCSLKGHAGSVYSVAFSPDGQRLASASADQTVKIWDSSTGKELSSLKGHASLVTSVAFSPDGRRLASGSDDRTAKIWDSATSKELFSLKRDARVLSVAFSPDGKRLASASDDKTVTISDSETGKKLLLLKGDAEQVARGAISPDGQRFTSAVTFSPDGRRLASGNYDQVVKIWDTTTGKELFVLKGHADWVMSVAFSPDGQHLASASFDGKVKIWDCTTGKELFALGSDPKIVQFWDSTHGKEVAVLAGASGEHAASVMSVAFSPDGRRLASGSFDGKVRIWDNATGNELFAGHINWPASVAFSPDGQQLASGSNDNTVKIWDTASGEELLSIKGGGAIALSADGRRLASGDDEGTVKIWDSATGKELCSPSRHPNKIASTPFRPWTANVVIPDSKGPPTKIASVAFSPDGQRLASGSYDRTVKIWDALTGNELFSLIGHTSVVESVAFSPNGQRLASGSWDKTVKVWDSATGKELFSLKSFASAVYCVTFSPDGQRLASGSGDGKVKIWDSATDKELFSLKGHTGPVYSVSFSADGQRLASASADGSINLWEASISPEVPGRRAARQLVADLFRQVALRTDIVERLRTLPGMSPTRRQEALAAARTYPENPSLLNSLAWEMVKLPGREMPDYHKALRYSEEACQLEPENGLSLNTLGAAYYRVGNYEKARETLLRSDQINKTQNQRSVAADPAFLAMTQHQLGRHREAQAELERLRERMKDPRLAHNAEAEGFLREAEALLAKPKTSAGN
jgi:eukaryotic-like serine/threonine-protein kinase